MTADGIAINLGFDKNSQHRATAGLLYMLEQQVLNGHTCYPLHELIEKTASELLIDKNTLEKPLNQLLDDRLIHCSEQNDKN